MHFHLGLSVLLVCPCMIAVQTCEDSSCPFSRMLTLRAATELCTQLFGIPEEKLPGNVAFTNMYYGGDHPQTHRVLYVNGGGFIFCLSHLASYHV